MGVTGQPERPQKLPLVENVVRFHRIHRPTALSTTLFLFSHKSCKPFANFFSPVPLKGVTYSQTGEPHLPKQTVLFDPGGVFPSVAVGDRRKIPSGFEHNDSAFLSLSTFAELG
jgi:hypothetical protein